MVIIGIKIVLSFELLFITFGLTTLGVGCEKEQKIFV